MGNAVGLNADVLGKLPPAILQHHAIGILKTQKDLYDDEYGFHENYEVSVLLCQPGP
jgi:hypothetical protein